MADSKFNIAGVLYQQGWLDKAETLYKEVGDVYETNPKVPQDKVAANYNNLGSICYQKGEYAEAAEYFGKALAIYRRVLGDNHPLTRNAAQNSTFCKQKIETQNQQ